jgi:hypothetical protein
MHFALINHPDAPPSSSDAAGNTGQEDDRRVVRGRCGQRPRSAGEYRSKDYQGFQVTEVKTPSQPTITEVNSSASI